ncbi:MAG: LON peptidase substrate-binding domain-containing protein, partial [Lachnospiraceae bacterium]|nr:LON peptidase substrate-binding domain-containing protein [Lachnospiraceae bacterium]
MSEKICELPVIALRGLTIIPGTTVHFDVSRGKSIKAAETAMMNDQRLFVVAQKDSNVNNPNISDLYGVGSIVKVKQLVKLPNKLVRVLVEAEKRGELNNFLEEEEYLLGEIYEKEDLVSDMTMEEEEARYRVLKDSVLSYGAVNSNVNSETTKSVASESSLKDMLFQIALSFPMDYKEKQDFLEVDTLSEQFDVAVEFLSKEIEINKIKEDIRVKVKERVDKNQRDYLLREQLKVIREELGEETGGSDADRYQEELEKLDAPEEVKE